MLGLKDLAQLEKIYGVQEATSIIGLLNTKILFRSPDDQTARKLSSLLGEQEESEVIEGLSFGAHHMRDGVSLSNQRRIRTAVPYTDFLCLKDLEAYIRFPGPYPIAKTAFYYQKREPHTAPFILNEEHISNIIRNEECSRAQSIEDAEEIQEFYDDESTSSPPYCLTFTERT